ncbi:MAG: FtsQ-type POTRA domain-containing protein, partial [Deltaproteobacteria bacterium]|nr:FtsQ-type POTRA domain-containing protein [Deltaproteobacteria bacterium]
MSKKFTPMKPAYYGPQIIPLVTVGKRQNKRGGKAAAMESARKGNKATGGKFWALSLGLPKLTSIGILIRSGLKLLILSIIRCIIIIFLLGLILMGYIYISKSDYLMVQPQSILITGLSKLSRTEVLEVAGLNIPVNNLLFDTTNAKNKLKANPWVETVETSKTFPSGLTINIVEYEPRAIVSLNTLYYIDEKGTPFKKLDPGELTDLPLISGFTEDDLASDSPLVRESLMEIFGLVETLGKRRDEFKASNIAEFHFDRDRGITVFTRRTGLQIKVGLGDFQRKFWRLGKVMSFLRREELAEGLEYLNLEY